MIAARTGTPEAEAEQPTRAGQFNDAVQPKVGFWPNALKKTQLIAMSEALFRGTTAKIGGYARQELSRCECRSLD
jgi:hypothetical protein